MNDLHKIYRNAVIIPAFTAILLTILFFIGDYFFGEAYESEWLTKESFYPITLIIVTINGLIISILALPILLNFYPKVRNQIGLRYIGFILPFLWLIFLILQFSYLVFLEGYEYLGFSEFITTLLINAFILVLPYIFGLLISYKQLEKNLNKFNQHARPTQNLP